MLQTWFLKISGRYERILRGSNSLSWTVFLSCLKIKWFILLFFRWIKLSFCTCLYILCVCYRNMRRAIQSYKLIPCSGLRELFISWLNGLLLQVHWFWWGRILEGTWREIVLWWRDRNDDRIVISCRREIWTTKWNLNVDIGHTTTDEFSCNYWRIY